MSKARLGGVQDQQDGGEPCPRYGSERGTRRCGAVARTVEPSAGLDSSLKRQSSYGIQCSRSAVAVCGGIIVTGHVFNLNEVDEVGAYVTTAATISLHTIHYLVITRPACANCRRRQNRFSCKADDVRLETYRVSFHINRCTHPCKLNRDWTSVIIFGCVQNQPYRPL